MNKINEVGDKLQAVSYWNQHDSLTAAHLKSDRARITHCQGSIFSASAVLPSLK
jgi:hypothetical protein